MGNEPSKHHSYLSANSVLLAQEDTYAPSVKNILILLNALLLVILVIGGLWMVFGDHTENRFAPATVPEDGFSFSVLFYKNAAVQASRDNNYLTMQDTKGQEVSIWATEIDRSLGCGSKPSLDYTPQRSTSVQSGCYEEDRLTFATAIRVDKQLYQVNITSKKPLSTADVKDIFGSIVIEK